MENKNSIQLLGYYGGDIEHACSAWTSTNRDLTEDKINRIPALLKMLATDGHHTPFEKSCIHFLVNTDIATHIHLLKHRIGVPINGESARYKEIKEDKYLLPHDWFNQKANVDDIMSGDFDNWADVLNIYTQLGNSLYHKALADLTPALGRKRAKESARFFKTYNSQIQADVMFNWRSFMHFQKLRNDEHAQVEVREIAQGMLDLVKQLPNNPFQYSLEAFNH